MHISHETGSTSCETMQLHDAHHKKPCTSHMPLLVAPAQPPLSLYLYLLMHRSIFLSTNKSGSYEQRMQRDHLPQHTFCPHCIMRSCRAGMTRHVFKRIKVQTKMTTFGGLIGKDKITLNARKLQMSLPHHQCFFFLLPQVGLDIEPLDRSFFNRFSSHGGAASVSSKASVPFVAYAALFSQMI